MAETRLSFKYSSFWSAMKQQKYKDDLGDSFNPIRLLDSASDEKGMTLK